MAVFAAILFQNGRKQEVIVLAVLGRVFAGRDWAHMRKRKLPFRKSVPTVCFPNFDVYSYISKFFAQFMQLYFEFCLLRIE